MEEILKWLRNLQQKGQQIRPVQAGSLNERTPYGPFAADNRPPLTRGDMQHMDNILMPQRKPWDDFYASKDVQSLSAEDFIRLQQMLETREQAARQKRDEASRIWM